MLFFSDRAGSTMPKLDNSKESSSQKPVTEESLQSYKSDLHCKETPVSTHSIHPKITSVSLQYEEEQSTESQPRVCDRNSVSVIEIPTVIGIKPASIVCLPLREEIYI